MVCPVTRVNPVKMDPLGCLVCLDSRDRRDCPVCRETGDSRATLLLHRLFLDQKV